MSNFKFFSATSPQLIPSNNERTEREGRSFQPSKSRIAAGDPGGPDMISEIESSTAGSTAGGLAGGLGSYKKNIDIHYTIKETSVA